MGTRPDGPMCGHFMLHAQDHAEKIQFGDRLAGSAHGFTDLGNGGQLGVRDPQDFRSAATEIRTSRAGHRSETLMSGALGTHHLMPLP
jgi:hypothetical protein